jgi:hypothetical protein
LHQNNALTACFDPHHSIVLFDDRGVPAAEIVVCFECDNWRLYPSPNGRRESGIGPEARRFLAELCRTLRVGGCPAEGQGAPVAPPGDGVESESVPSWSRSGPEWGRAHTELATGVAPDRLMNTLDEADRRKLCAWSYRADLLGGHFRCPNGTILPTPPTSFEECLNKVGTCKASVADFVDCQRGTFAHFCEPQPSTCENVRSCQLGFWARRSP